MVDTMKTAVSALKLGLSSSQTPPDQSGGDLGSDTSKPPMQSNSSPYPITRPSTSLFETLWECHQTPYQTWSLH